MPKKTTRSPEIQVVSNVVCNMGQKRIGARQELFNSCTVITVLMNLMKQKSLLSSGRGVSSEELEHMKSDTYKLSESLRHLVTLGHHYKTVEQVKALLAKLDVGMYMSSTADKCCYIILCCHVNLGYLYENYLCLQYTSCKI